MDQSDGYPLKGTHSRFGDLVEFRLEVTSTTNTVTVPPIEFLSGELYGEINLGTQPVVAEFETWRAGTFSSSRYEWQVELVPR